VQKRPRRDDRVQLPEHERALNLASELCLARELKPNRPDHPDDREAGQRSGDEAAGRIERAQAGEAQSRAEARTGRASEGFQQHRQPGGPGERDERRIGRSRPAVEQMRSEAAAENRAADEPREREAAPHEAPSGSAKRGEPNEPECNPVEAGHLCLG
jgi:hypothetical protein